MEIPVAKQLACPNGHGVAYCAFGTNRWFCALCNATLVPMDWDKVPPQRRWSYVEYRPTKQIEMDHTKARLILGDAIQRGVDFTVNLHGWANLREAIALILLENDDLYEQVNGLNEAELLRPTE